MSIYHPPTNLSCPETAFARDPLPASPCPTGPLTHGEKQGRYGSESAHMDHGQDTGEMALAGSSKKQPV